MLPWQTELFRQLWRVRNENRLPHALLFSGVKGTKKARFADHFSRALLCQQVTLQGESCHQCHACRLIEGRVHPSILWVEPEKEEAAIKVDQVRVVTDFINQTALQGECRIAIIHPADNMNVNAANALLKTLEEPSSDALLILITDQRRRLPATIVSRCQRFFFPPPDREQLLAWMVSQPSRQDLFQSLLRLAEGQSDPVQLAAHLQSNDLLPLLDFFLSWMMDLLRLQLSGGLDGLINKDYTEQLITLKQKTQLKKNLTLLEYVQQLRGQLGEGIHFNTQLMLESIFVQWMECV